ncbi:MAG: cytochrome c biogenesis protein CcsA [Calditrichia bacterium]|nr:cytochrome c biogenesis protein CcsA [Calditrichia bacterium]
MIFIYLPLVFAGAFFYAPTIKGLGETGKVIIFHVPCSWITVIAFLISAVFSVRILHALSKKKDGIIKYDVWAAGAAQIGFLFALLATVTGSIWAKKIWHSYWNWDPRETSIFILLLIYAAYFALRSAFTNEQDKIRISAVYSIIAFFTVPFFIFIIPRVYESLHPNPIINESRQMTMDYRMKYVFFASLFGFTVFFWYLLKIKIRLQMLINKKEEILEEINE